MGARGELAAIVDAGPLIHLAEISGLRLLTLFNPILLPGEVWRETVGVDRIPAVALDEVAGLERHEAPIDQVAEYVKQNELGRLHGGECECLWLSRHLGITTLLTDDLAVREAAGKLGITPVGSLGIVVRACRLARITRTEAETYLMDLYNSSSLYVTRVIVELALEHLDRHSRGTQ